MNKNKKKLITHNGSFHADDIFATAALSIYLESKGEEFEIIRTRDPEIMKTGDYVYDVGGIYDEATNRFDHHQAEGAGTGAYGIEYSSLGLVWKKFGEEIAGGSKPAKIIERRLCAPIDAWDNGFDVVKSAHEISPYYIQNVFFAMLPTWKEHTEDIDKVFLKCVELAKMILEREIIQARDVVEAEEAILSAYEKSADKRIVVLEKNYPFEYVLFNFPEPIYAIYPRKTGDSWGVKCIRKDLKTFTNRKDLPESWAGLKDEELQKVTGVADAIFCHRARFTAVAKSKEGAIKLAELAVKQ
ncbi:MAG: MYG1 family protein [Candidatus Paceibacterota bacterium]|jgi:uncharacterized UPF0160 family protein